jgi:hypothetical protein
MPIYAGEMNRRYGIPLSEYPASLGDVLRTQAEETRYTNPLKSLSRLNEQSAARRGELLDPGDPMEGRLPVFGEVRRLDAATARERIQQERLPLTVPDDGVAEKLLDLQIKAKREELRRQDVFSRGPDGFVAGAARLGVGLVESFFDPLNIASAFVPVIGPARYAGLVAGAGGAGARAGIRAGVGAAEGIVGAAILEPIIYAAQRGEQADYTMADSLLNIGFGGIFGGGLHAGGGALRDVFQPGWWRMADQVGTPTTREQATAGMPPATAKALFDPPLIERNPKALDALNLAQRIADSEAKPGFQRTADDMLALQNPRTPEIDRAAQVLATPAFARSAEDSLFIKALEKGHEVDYINQRMSRTLEAMDAVDQRALARGNSPDSLGASTAKRALSDQLVSDSRRMLDLGRNPMESSLVLARVSPETRHAALRAAIAQAAEGRAITVDALIAADPYMRQQTGLSLSQATENARQAAKNAPMMSAEPKASEAARALSREAEQPNDVKAAEQELTFHMEQSKAMTEALGMEDMLDTIKPFDDAIRRAEDYGKALRAGAACGVA